MDVNVGETDASLVVGEDAKSQFMRRDMRFKGGVVDWVGRKQGVLVMI